MDKRLIYTLATILIHDANLVKKKCFSHIIHKKASTTFSCNDMKIIIRTMLRYSHRKLTTQHLGKYTNITASCKKLYTKQLF